ncbi:MAG: hypothetical protein ACYCT9_00515 [Leptospirillum sp.]|jgi:hypothetical protein
MIRVGRGFYDGSLKSIKISRDFVFSIENFIGDEEGRYTFDVGDEHQTCRGAGCFLVKDPVHDQNEFFGTAFIDSIEFFVEAKKRGNTWSFIFSTDQTLRFVNDNLYYIKKGVGESGPIIYSKRIFNNK